MILSSISLPERSARSRTTRGNREKSSSTGTMPMQVDRRVPDLPADPLEGFKGVQPGNEPGDFAQALEVVGKHSQLAGQADQVVELQGMTRTRACGLAPGKGDSPPTWVPGPMDRPLPRALRQQSAPRWKSMSRPPPLSSERRGRDRSRPGLRARGQEMGRCGMMPGC